MQDSMQSWRVRRVLYTPTVQYPEYPIRSSCEPGGRGPVSLAQHVAIGFREVDVGEDVADAGQRREHVLLLDVHVEGIDHHVQARQAEAADQLGHLGDGIVEADFAVVHRLEGHGHALLRGVLAQVADGVADTGGAGGWSARR